MREIKFRAWDKENKCWITPQEWGQEVKASAVITYGNPAEIELKNDQWCEWVQFTGLHDRNGKEIYEGDILKVKDSGAPIYKAPIEWIDAGFWITDAHGGHYRPASKYIEIIGNIYENPELTK